MREVAFRVDVDELRDVVTQLVRADARLRGLAAEVEAQVRALRATWQGRTAEAHDIAHREWVAGFDTMRGALAEVRAAGDTAHGHYTSAARTNVSLWEQVT